MKYITEMLYGVKGGEAKLGKTFTEMRRIRQYEAFLYTMAERASEWNIVSIDTIRAAKKVDAAFGRYIERKFDTVQKAAKLKDELYLSRVVSRYMGTIRNLYGHVNEDEYKWSPDDYYTNSEGRDLHITVPGFEDRGFTLQELRNWDRTVSEYTNTFNDSMSSTGGDRGTPELRLKFFGKFRVGPFHTIKRVAASKRIARLKRKKKSYGDNWHKVPLVPTYYSRRKDGSLFAKRPTKITKATPMGNSNPPPKSG